MGPVMVREIRKGGRAAEHKCATKPPVDVVLVFGTHYKGRVQGTPATGDVDPVWCVEEQLLVVLCVGVAEVLTQVPCGTRVLKQRECVVIDEGVVGGVEGVVIDAGCQAGDLVVRIPQMQQSVFGGIAVPGKTTQRQIDLACPVFGADVFQPYTVYVSVVFGGVGHFEREFFQDMVVLDVQHHVELEWEPLL